MKYITILLLALLTSNHSYAQEITLDDLRGMKSNFESKHNIKLYIEDIPFSTRKIEYDVVTKEYYNELYDYINLLDNEISKYPASFIKKSKLKAISLIRVLLNSALYRTAGVPDYDREILFLDFGLASYDKNYQKRAIHHEFFHMIEQEFNNNIKDINSEWLKLNTPNFKYGVTGWSALNSRVDVVSINHPELGFVSLYSKTSIQEGKAEVFATLFADDEFIKLNRWIKKDKYLNKKVNNMKLFLKNIDNAISDVFWDKLHKPT